MPEARPKPGTSSEGWHAWPHEAAPCLDHMPTAIALMPLHSAQGKAPHVIQTMKRSWRSLHAPRQQSMHQSAAAAAVHALISRAGCRERRDRVTLHPIQPVACDQTHLCLQHDTASGVCGGR